MSAWDVVIRSTMFKVDHHLRLIRDQSILSRVQVPDPWDGQAIFQKYVTLKEDAKKVASLHISWSETKIGDRMASRTYWKSLPA